MQERNHDSLDESVGIKPEVQFQIDFMQKRIEKIIEDFTYLKDVYGVFKKLKEELEKKGFLQVNRISKISNDLSESLYHRKSLTPYEFNEEVEKGLYSIKYILLELSDILKYASGSEGVNLGLDKFSFSCINNGETSTMDLTGLYSFLYNELNSLRKEYEKLLFPQIVKDKKPNS